VLFWGLRYTPASAPLWADLKLVAGEVQQLRAELAARKAPLDLRLEYSDTGHSLDRGIEWIAKTSAGDLVILAVNADPNPVEVQFSGLAEFRSCKTLFQPRHSVLAGGRFRDSFGPFDARAYRLATDTSG
jgi:hypothetical protein